MRNCAAPSEKEGIALSEEHVTCDVKDVPEPSAIGTASLSDRESEALLHNDSASALTHDGAFAESNNEGVPNEEYVNVLLITRVALKHCARLPSFA